MHDMQPDLGVARACSTGNHRKSLEALRDKLARAADEAVPAVVAQIAGRLQAVLEELATLPTAEENESDELAKRRQAHRDAANAKLRPKKRRPRTELGT